MFELRWLDRPKVERAGAYKIVSRERVLQYRTQQVVLNHDGEPEGGRWFDWRDVPTETEGGSK